MDVRRDHRLNGGMTTSPAVARGVELLPVKVSVAQRQRVEGSSQGGGDRSAAMPRQAAQGEGGFDTDASLSPCSVISLCRNCRETPMARAAAEILPPWARRCSTA